MKKLLALVLCVMMFVSVIPTSAFAAYSYPDVENPLDTVAQYNKEIKNMIKHTRENIEFAYGVLTMDQVVYNAAKSMDDVICNLVDGIADPLIAKNKFTKAHADNVKNAVRDLFDDMVTEKMNDNIYKAYDKDGKLIPTKYAQVFADAVSSSLTSKKFQKGYEAVATYFALANLVSDVNDKLKDGYTDFFDSVDTGFDEKFADRYPDLSAAYIDSFTEAVPYGVNNAVVLAAIEAATKEGADEETIKELGEMLIPIDPWAAKDYAYVGSPD